MTNLCVRNTDILLYAFIVTSALREAEEMADAKLSDDDFDIEAASAKLGIDVNSLNLDDDNDDQIMSILGKRPGSSKSSASAADSPPLTSYPPKEALLELNEDDQMIKEDIIVDADGQLKRMKEKKETDIVDDIFRAKVKDAFTLNDFSPSTLLSNVPHL